MVISPDPSAVVEHIQEAAIQLRGETTPPQLAPPEFAWIIDVRIPEPTNPLARAASVADLLDLLGAYGLKRDDLARVKELRLYTQSAKVLMVTRSDCSQWQLSSARSPP